MRKASNIFWLGIKELQSLSHDFVLCAFLIWSFSLAVLTQAQGHLQEVYQASFGFIDEDNSELSRRIIGAFQSPEFKPPAAISERDVDQLMNTGQYTFVVDIPPNFQRDVEGRRRPALQLDVDATAMMQAGIGAGHAQQIINDEITRFTSRVEPTPSPPVDLALRIAYNPNADPAWFTSVMAIINNVTILGIILPGAAIVREREHGTMDHLLGMPLTAFEIAMAKVWANALVITVAVAFCLYFVVRQLLGVPIAGSIPLFLAGVAFYLFFANAIGIFIGTVARSMPQLGLLVILTALPLNMLSGANTPLESMPSGLRTAMQASPATHFVAMAQGILSRGAGLDVEWPHFLVVAAAGILFFALALRRFRAASAYATL
jgi:ABC-2 type transport system permease protein